MILAYLSTIISTKHLSHHVSTHRAKPPRHSKPLIPGQTGPMTDLLSLQSTVLVSVNIFFLTVDSLWFQQAHTTAYIYNHFSYYILMFCHI